MKRLLLTASLLAGAAALATPANADLVYNFLPTNTFSGTAPAGTLTADFHTVATGTVTLTITSNLAAGEFVLPKDGFYFNVISSYNATLLTLATNSLPPSVSGATLATGSDAFKPDGDGLMDLELTFSPTNAKAFVGGEIGVFTLTGTGVTENTFDALSLCATGCGHGSHYAAVHVGDTPLGGSGSAWVGGTPGTLVPAPEPISLTVLGSGLLGLSLARRKRG
jgi:hypothetical protein